MKAKMTVHQEEEEWRPETFWILVISVNALLLGICVYLYLTTTTEWVFRGRTIVKINWGIVAFGLQLFYNLFSIKTLDTQEAGTKKFLGMRIQRVRPGPVFVPLLFFELAHDPRTIVQLEIGTPQITPGREEEYRRVMENEKIFVVRSNWEPQRITFAEGKSMKDSKGKDKVDMNDPLNGRLTCEPTVVLRLRIIDHWAFHGTIGNLPTAIRHINDASVTALQEKAAVMTPAQALAHISDLNHGITEAIEVLIGEKSGKIPDPSRPGKFKLVTNPFWGIDLIGCQLKSLGIPKDPNKAIALNAAAGFEKQTIETRAAAEKEKRIKEGQGAANARKELLLAEAEGAKAQAKQAKTPEGQFALQQQTIREAFKEANYSILPAGDLGNVLTMASGIKQALKSTPEGEKENTPVEPPESKGGKGKGK